jgi:pimeloyl-ACP methyl ester carboxylesterase
MVVRVKGIDLFYETAGSGEPLLWLHGFMGGGSDWQYIFPEPPAGFQVIAPDLRGHGRSSKSANFSFREAAGDVAELLRHLRLDSVKAIGLSGGGITLLHLATAAPHTIDSMVLVSAPPYFPVQARALQRQASEAMFGATEVELMRGRHGDAAFQRLLAQSRAFADSYDDVNFTPPYLGMITAETLIVFGDRDPFYPVSLAFELRSAIPKSRLWVVPDAGHAPAFGPHAARFAETALAFLRGEWSH